MEQFEPPGNLARDYLCEVIEEPNSHPESSDWKWQLRNRITSFEVIRKLIKLTPEEKEGFKRSNGRLAMAITPYFFSLIDRNDPNCPIRKQAIPRTEEFRVSPEELVDPCGEDSHSPAAGLVHRYPDRVLLLVTDSCAMYCRYCTRNRIVGVEKPPMGPGQFEEALRYIRADKNIRDVLISGGDPLMLTTPHLEQYIKRLRAIPHIDILRIGTRVPVALPMRVDEELAAMLKKYHPLYISIHFSHPKEITPQVKRACEMLADSGIPLGSQTVLLKGINDKPAIMKKLVQKLLRIRVRPYYLYQCDLACGTAHFRTPISTGLNIIEKLRGHTTGYAVPTFVIDAPGGGGKIPIGPEYVVSRQDGKITLKNYEGKIFEYVEAPDE
ncbi:MAG: KamA family radical SAM protein [Deltaproteobacteria bacterium]|nr:KamA family radical SAM protein [Deltaproteobacteria bacterium]